MITPVQMNDAFLADVAAADADDGFALWWLGQSGFLVKHRGRHLLLDPYLSDALTRKYAGTDKPHERMTRLIVDPARLDFIDVVASSHHHSDHFDAETIGPLLAVNADLQVIVPEASRELAAERLGVAPDRLIGLDDGLETQVAGFRLLGVPAAHETIERDQRGRCKFLGYVVRMGDLSIYHSGDTVPYDGMARRLGEARVDVALLPINGRSPQRGVPGNLSAEEAAELAHRMGVRLAIACHYEMFRFNTASPQPFVDACQRLAQRCRVLKCGERFSSRELGRSERSPEGTVVHRRRAVVI